MVLTWIVFVFQILFWSIFRSGISDLDVLVVYIIGFTSVPLLVHVMRIQRCPRWAIIGGYFFRLSIMFFDVYYRHIFVLPQSSGDAEGFFAAAVRISHDLSLLKKGIYGGFYSKLLGLLYFLTGPNRLLGQFLNVLLGMSIIFILLQILELLLIDDKAKRWSMFVVCFFPHSILFSGILLRENIVTFFVTASLYFFIKWIMTGSLSRVIAAIVLLLAGSAFHAGVIGLFAGYAFMFMFYVPRTGKFEFRPSTVAAFIFLLVLSLVVFLRFGHVFLSKFQRVDDIGAIYRVASEGRGGSAYLTNLRINSLWQLVVYAPIKMLYFLFVPLPQHWRGINDVISFVMDGAVYMWFVMHFIKGKTKIEKEPLAIGMMICIVGVVFVFGIGVSNAGTALRHRHKIFPVFLVLFSLIKGRNSLDRLAVRHKERESRVDLVRRTPRTML